MAGAVAQERSRNISENMQRAIARRFEQGISTNYKAFIGYQCIDGKLDIVPEQEEILNRARPLRTTDGNQISSGKQIAVFVGMWGLQGGFRYRTEREKIVWRCGTRLEKERRSVKINYFERSICKRYVWKSCV